MGLEDSNLYLHAIQVAEESGTEKPVKNMGAKLHKTPMLSNHQSRYGNLFVTNQCANHIPHPAWYQIAVILMQEEGIYYTYELYQIGTIVDTGKAQKGITTLHENQHTWQEHYCAP